MEVLHGTLYPALKRLEMKGWIDSKREICQRRVRPGERGGT